MDLLTAALLALVAILTVLVVFLLLKQAPDTSLQQPLPQLPQQPPIISYIQELPTVSTWPPWWSWPPSDWTNDWSYGNYYNGRPLYAHRMEKGRKRQKKIKKIHNSTSAIKPPQIININVKQSPNPIPTIDAPPSPIPLPSSEQHTPLQPPPQPQPQPSAIPLTELQVKTPEVILPSQI